MDCSKTRTNCIKGTFPGVGASTQIDVEKSKGQLFNGTMAESFVAGKEILDCPVAKNELRDSSDLFTDPENRITPKRKKTRPPWYNFSVAEESNSIKSLCSLYCALNHEGGVY